MTSMKWDDDIAVRVLDSVPPDVRSEILLGGGSTGIFVKLTPHLRTGFTAVEVMRRIDDGAHRTLSEKEVWIAFGYAKAGADTIQAQLGLSAWWQETNTQTFVNALDRTRTEDPP